MWCGFVLFTQFTTKTGNKMFHAGPRNKAIQEHSLLKHLSRVCLVRMKVAEKETHRDGSRK